MCCSLAGNVCVHVCACLCLRVCVCVCIVSECLFFFGAKPTCFSTLSSTDPFGLTRFVTNQCCALSVTSVRLASIVCVC